MAFRLLKNLPPFCCIIQAKIWSFFVFQSFVLIFSKFCLWVCRIIPFYIYFDLATLQPSKLGDKKEGEDFLGLALSWPTSLQAEQCQQSSISGPYQLHFLGRFLAWGDPKASLTVYNWAFEWHYSFFSSRLEVALDVEVKKGRLVSFLLY